MHNIFLYSGGILPLIWGIAHLFPTRGVVAGFGEISQDNKYIIAMEWIVEGVVLIFIGLLTIIITLIDSGSNVAIAVYWLVFIVLNVLSVISLFTGFRIKFLPFKICPVLFTGSSLSVLTGILSIS